MNISPTLQAFFEPWSVFLAQDPLLRIVQFALVFGGVIAVFLVFYTTRDILLRSRSFVYMFCSILLVALLPIIGFFLYLLLRPARTIKERELEALVRTFVADQAKPATKVAEKSSPKVDSKKATTTTKTKKKAKKKD